MPATGRKGFALDLADLRGSLRLTQAGFAERFGLACGTVRDLEQGRCEPSCAMRVLAAVIALDPEIVDQAKALALERFRAADGQ